MKNKIWLGLVIAITLLLSTFMVSAIDVSYSDSYLPKSDYVDTGVTAGAANSIMSVVEDIQSNDEQTVKSRYPKVEISSDGFLGLFPGDPIIDFEIIDHTEFCTIDCYSILQVNVFQATTLMDELKTNSYVGNQIDNSLDIETHVYILKNVSYDIPEPVYQRECKTVNPASDVSYEECADYPLQVVHTTGYRQDFVEYNNEQLEPGKYIIKITGKKSSFNQIVDWVPKIQGQEINALAWWNITNPYGNGSLGNVYISTVAGERNFGSMTASDYSFSAVTNTLTLYTDRIYQFNSFYLGSGTTLTTSNTTGSALYLMAVNNITINGIVNLTGKLQAGQANGTSFSYLGDSFTTPSVGNGGQANGANATGYQAYGFGGGGRGGLVIGLGGCSYTSGTGSNASFIFGSGGSGGTSSILKTQSNQCSPTGTHDGGNGIAGGGGGGASQIYNGAHSCTYSSNAGAGGSSYGANGASGSSAYWGRGVQNTFCNTGSFGSFDLQSYALGGGGAGGSAGRPGLNLVLRSKTLTVNNNIYLSGTNGQNGGNGGSYVYAFDTGDSLYCGNDINCMGQVTGNSGYGAGGGGGASAGNAVLYYRILSNSSSLNTLISRNAGTGGIGGYFADGSTGQAQSGSDGSSGNITQYQEGYAQTTLLLPANGDSVVVTPIVNFTATINPVISVTLVNATFYLWKNGTLNNTQTTVLAGTSPVNLSWNLPSTNFPDNTWKWAVLTCWTDGTVPKCEQTTNNTFTTFSVLFANSTIYTTPTYEMINATFKMNVTSTGFVNLTSTFMWDGVTPYATTTIGNNTNAQFIANFNIPIGNGTHTFHWHVSYGGQLKESTPENITVLPSLFGICDNSTLTVHFIGINYRDETTNNPINATIVSSIWTYNITGSPFGKQLVYSSPSFNGTQNTSLQHNFCFSPAFASIIIPTADYQYGNSPLGYSTKTFPFRDVTLTNSSTLYTLYLINLVDSGVTPITFQVVSSQTSTVVSGVRVSVYRTISGTPTLVDDGYTDAAGTISYYMSPITAYTITASGAGCTTYTSTITPTNNQYNILLSCPTLSNQTFSTKLDGITYQRTPADGVNQPGTILYSYAINSNFTNMTRVKFELVDGTTGEVLDSNDSLTNNNYCSQLSCLLTLTYTTYTGDNIKGKYYVAINGTDDADLVLIEGDAYWRFIQINSNNSLNAIGRFMINVQDFFNTWGTSTPNCLVYTDQISCNNVAECKWVNQTIWAAKESPVYGTQTSMCIARDDLNKAEFNRIVTIFFFFVVFLFILGRTTGYELNHPGAFVAGMSAVIWVLSIYGMFTFAGLTTSNFFNQYIFALSSSCVGVGYVISVIRRYS